LAAERQKAHKLRHQVQRLQGEVEAMQSSKFWQMRDRWVKLKSLFKRR
jgi:hypothetical protein